MEPEAEVTGKYKTSAAVEVSDFQVHKNRKSSVCLYTVIFFLTESIHFKLYSTPYNIPCVFNLKVQLFYY